LVECPYLFQKKDLNYGKNRKFVYRIHKRNDRAVEKLWCILKIGNAVLYIEIYVYIPYINGNTILKGINKTTYKTNNTKHYTVEYHERKYIVNNSIIVITKDYSINMKK
jgi:hypothetical protein